MKSCHIQYRTKNFIPIHYIIYLSFICFLSLIKTEEFNYNYNSLRNMDSENQDPYSFKYFQRLKMPSTSIFFANEKRINLISNPFTKITSLDYQQEISLNSINDLEYISIGILSTFDLGYYVLFKVNQYYFITADSHTYFTAVKSSFTLDLPKINNLIIPYKCSQISNSQDCQFFTGYIDSNSYYIYKYEIRVFNGKPKLISQKNNSLIDSNNQQLNSKIEYIPCEYVIDSLNNAKLVCFFIGNNELIAITFDPENELDEILKIYKENINAKYIKTTICDKIRKKILLCYMDDIGAVSCLVYDSIENKFSEETKYFSQSIVSFSEFDIFYAKNLEEYVIQSYKSNLEMQIIILNEQFQISDKQKNCDFSYTLPNCEYRYVSYVGNQCDNNDGGENKYFVIYTCKVGDEGIFQIQELILNCNKTNNDSEINDVKIEYYLDEEEKVYKAETSKSKEEIIKNLNDVIDDIVIGELYEIKGDDFELKIHPINSNVNKNSTNVNFLECENILRKQYGLSEDSILTTLQIEINSQNDKSLTNKVEYTIFDENKNELDLSYCSNVQIKINYQIKDPSILNNSLINSFSDLGIDILNINDDFFNDICYTYGDNDTDIILEDRLKDIYQNYSICDDNCKYDKINIQTNMIECSCNVKTNISSNNETTNFANMVLTTFKNTNFAVIKCFKLVFSIEGITGNFGFYIFLILIIIHIPLIIIYFLYGINPIKLFIFKEMKNKNFLYRFGNPVNKRRSSYINERNVNNNSIGPNINFKVSINNINEIKLEPRNSELLKRSKTKLKKNIKISSGSSSNLNLIYNPKNEEANDNFYMSSNKIIPFNTSNRKNINIKNKNIDNIYVNKRNKNKISFEEPGYPGYYYLIRVNGLGGKIKEPPKSNFILSIYDFKEAIKFDTRSFWRIFFMCLLYRQSILHTFFFRSYMEIKSLRIMHFIFGYSLDFALNAFFYSNSKISDRYNYEGDKLYLYSMINNLTISICSTVVSFVLRICCKKLINSNKNIETVFRKEENNIKKSKKGISKSKMEEITIKIIGILEILKIKILIFIIFELILMLFFTYYITAFCAVYKETQSSWFSDSVVSFIMSNFMELLFSFGIALLYTLSLSYKIETLFKISLYLYDLGH